MALKFVTVSLLSAASLLPSGAATVDSSSLVQPAIYNTTTHDVQYTRVVANRRYHRRHARRRTVRRVAVGAAGGAAIGAIAGGGPGAAIGAIAGGGAGALYDAHEKHHGH